MSAVLEARQPSARYLEAVQPALVRQFQLLATAPGGVVRLRELVYILAAGGYLAPKTDSDCLMKLGEVAEFIMGQAPPGVECNKVGEGTVFVKTGEFGALYPEVCEWTTKPLKFAQTGDVLICVVGATIGKLNLAIDCAIGRSVAAVRPAEALHTKYLYYALMPFTLALRKASRGSAQGVIGKTDLASIELRVPPPDEQDAIVARVDELMRLCDALEVNGRLEAEQHARLLGVLLGTLTDSSTPEELAANWQRVAEHFDLLLDRPEAVDALEQTILQLAVRGLLVPQLSSDQSASSLLEQIRASGEQKKAQGKKVGAVASEVQPDEVPFEVPDSWAWSRFGQIAEIASDLVQPAGHGSEWQVAPDCIEKGTGRLLAKRTVADADVKSANHRFHPGQIIYSKIRPSLSKAVIVDFAGLCSADMYPINAKISTQYLLLVILSRCFLDQVAAAENRVKMPKLNQEALTAFLVPVPPLAEQERIVARVTDLRQLCTDLRQRLSRSSAAQAALAEALIDYVLVA